MCFFIGIISKAGSNCPTCGQKITNVAQNKTNAAKQSSPKKEQAMRVEEVKVEAKPVPKYTPVETPISTTPSITTPIPSTITTHPTPTHESHQPLPPTNWQTQPNPIIGPLIGTIISINPSL